MKLSQNAFNKLADRYLRHEMNEKERLAFEEQLASDDSFRKRFEEHRLAVEGLQRHFFQEELEAYLAKKSGPQTKTPKSSGIKFWPWIIGVLLVLMVGLLIWWSLPAPKPPVIEEENKQVAKSEQLFEKEDEPLVSTPTEYKILIDTLLLKSNTNKEIRVLVKLREGKQSGYLLYADTLHIWLLEATGKLKPDVVSLVERGKENLYLQLQDQWFRIDTAEQQHILEPEDDQNILRLLQEGN